MECCDGRERDGCPKRVYNGLNFVPARTNKGHHHHGGVEGSLCRNRLCKRFITSHLHTHTQALSGSPSLACCPAAKPRTRKEVSALAYLLSCVACAFSLSRSLCSLKAKDMVYLFRMLTQLERYLCLLSQSVCVSTPCVCCLCAK